MKKRWIFGTMAFSACVCLVAGADLQGAKPPSAVPLIVTVTNNEGHGLQGDNGEYRSGADNVLAELLSNVFGNFIFDANDNPRIDGGRRLRLYFVSQTAPAPGLTPNEWFDVDAGIGTIGVTQNAALDGNLRTMAFDENLQRRTRIGWEQGGRQYSLRWDGPEHYGEGYLNFHCDAYDGGCTQWTVTPQIGSTPQKAGLYTVSTSKGTTTDTYYGSFDMPFSMTLAKKPQ